MSQVTQRIVLAARPEGAVTAENFRMETVELPALGDGEVLVEVTALSLDPYMRGRMDAAKSYAKPVEVDEVMEGGTVGRVLASNHPKFAEGDLVMGMTGWQSHAVINGRELRKLDDRVPASTALGVLGMPGFTGWYGLTEIGKPKPGETLVVAAAMGPVGSLVGQYAKAKGLRVIGIAGGKEKCDHVVKEYGFDACLDHRAYADSRELRAALKEHCPDGIDIYFENVGGKVLQAVLPEMNVFGRIAICGMVAWYDQTGLGQDSPRDQLPWAWRNMLVNRLSVAGFIISDHFDRFADFLKDVGPMFAAGQIRHTEDVAEGLENAPEVFMSMLKGGNFGKQIVKVKD
ncbi:MAG: NADP-dependent oxidoreductase [Maritimibacter sp.]